MQREHNELLLKLEFVRDLSSSIIQIARSRSSPLAESVFVDDAVGTAGAAAASTAVAMSSDTCSAVFISEGQRRIEQLVLYMRALELLASALNLAKAALADGRLSPSVLTRQGLNSLIFSLCLVNLSSSLFNGQYSRSVCISWFRNGKLLDFNVAKVMEMALVQSGIRRAKIKPDHHHLNTNTQFFMDRVVIVCHTWDCTVLGSNLGHCYFALLPT